MKNEKKISRKEKKELKKKIMNDEKRYATMTPEQIYRENLVQSAQDPTLKTLAHTKEFEKIL